MTILDSQVVRRFELGVEVTAFRAAPFAEVGMAPAADFHGRIARKETHIGKRIRI